MDNFNLEYFQHVTELLHDYQNVNELKSKTNLKDTTYLTNGISRLIILQNNYHWKSQENVLDMINVSTTYGILLEEKYLLYYQILMGKTFMHRDKTINLGT